MNPTHSARVFPLGAHLCREPMPAMAEMKRDMEILKRHGFNLVKLQEHWACDEAVEGVYDFSKYEELIEHAASLGMGVYLGLTCEQAPAWLYRKHPDCRMVGRDGTPIAYEAQFTLPADGKPGPCFDHPGAMADQVRFITRLVENLGRYENVVVWNTWQEIGYWAEGLVGQSVCFCPNTLAHFRSWLMGRYADLDGLNKAWNTRYADWDDITPSRSVGGKGPFPNDLAWQSFMDNIQIAGVLKARYSAIKAADPLNRPVFAHKGGMEIGSGQDWTYARCQDFLGTSNYPHWNGMKSWDDGQPAPGHPLDRRASIVAEMHNLALGSDYLRSANGEGKQVWAAEFQGGPISTGLHIGRKPSPEDIRRWMLTSIGSGVTAISFWVTRAEISAGEINGFALLDSVGDTTPRLEEAGRVGEALNRHPELFNRPTRPRASVAIMVNEWNSQICGHVGDAKGHLAYSVRGWHRMLWEAGIPVDFIEASEIEAQGGHYHAMIVPFPVGMSEEVAESLAAYVERGGHLISEACPGRLTDTGYCNKGELSPRLRELFEVRQADLRMVREPENGARWMPGERTWGEMLDACVLVGVGQLAGARLRANLYLETFECSSSEPCLMAGDKIAGVVRKIGDGSAWLLGTFAGHSGTAYRDDEVRATVLRLLALCDVKPERHGRLLLRRRVSDGKEAWLFTNPTEETIIETIDTSGWAEVTDLFGTPLVCDGADVTISVLPFDVAGLVVSNRRRT